MLRKLLIANRGEIVSRILRTCRDMGIETVVVYSEPDKEAAYVSMADEAILIGPANPLQSYLNIDAILNAVRKTGADAVHPGYGFLSENAAFATAVVDQGLIWVGPSPEVLRVVDSKCYCRHLAHDVGVPVIPGTLDPVTAASQVKEYGREHGYPVFLKLDKGGGGKGIEMVRSEEDAEDTLKRASSIGQMAFGDPGCYIEEVVSVPRHIEIQFVADNSGNVMCLGERECSIQRRHQKIIEEAPSPVVTEQDREKLFDYSRRLVAKMQYDGSGTFEGLRSAEGNYYFMEVNARLQVEHPVTEMLTGIDIVRCQIETASGETLGFEQPDARMNGHAIEARVYAEDPETFFPSPGVITELSLPPQDENLRIDHALAPNTPVPPFYDPLLAKVIARGSNRQEAIERLVQGLKGFRIEGVKTTITANLRILQHPEFLSGEYSTDFIGKMNDGHNSCTNNHGHNEP